MEEETVCHALGSYSTSSDVWADLQSPVQKWWCREMEFIGFWEEMITRLQTKELEEVISILRRIWFRLNKFVFEQIFINPIRVIMEALQEMT